MTYKLKFTCPIYKEVVQHKRSWHSMYSKYEKREAHKVFDELVRDHFEAEHPETIEISEVDE